jgi:signal peptidase I
VVLSNVKSAQPKPQSRPIDARLAARQELLGELLRSTGRVSLEVSGASMLPAIWPGDRVTVQACTVGDLRAGDVISFWRDSFLVTHRVESLRGERILTQGDSAHAGDPPVAAENLLGRVVGIQRGDRDVSLAQRVWQRMAAFVLRRSTLCTRALLYARIRLRRVSTEPRVGAPGMAVFQTCVPNDVVSHGRA